MKVNTIALVLSFFLSNISVHAAAPLKPPISQPPLMNPIDLNKADLSVLKGSFKGIGEKRAKAIIEYREAHKGFKSIEELAEVKGIGQRFVDNNRDKLKKIYLIQ